MVLAGLEGFEAQTVWGIVVRGIGVLFVLAHASLLLRSDGNDV